MTDVDDNEEVYEEEDYDDEYDEYDDEAQAEFEAGIRRLVEVYEKGKGAPVKVNGVHIEGLKRTRNWIAALQVQHILAADTIGELVTRTEDAEGRLRALGIFREVNASIDTAPGVNAADVIFELEERGLISGDTGMTVGSNEACLNFSARVLNPLGVADKIVFSSSRTSAGNYLFDLCYSIPVAGDVYRPFSIHAFRRQLDLTPTSSHKQNLRGVAAEYQTFSLLGQHNLRYELVWRQVANFADQASFDIRTLAGDSLKSSIRHTLGIDLLNSEDGQEATIDVTTELAGSGLGGNVNFLKNNVEMSYKIPVLSGCQLGFSLRGGLLCPISGSEPRNASPLLTSDAKQTSMVPDRFFLGGPLDVRGFKQRGLGPHADNPNMDALGGDVYWAAGLHLYTPFIYRPWREQLGNMLRMHAFANIGSLTGVSNFSGIRDAISTIASKPVTATVGAGLCVSFRTFQLEVNYCLPVRWHEGEVVKPGLQFGVGFKFL